MLRYLLVGLWVCLITVASAYGSAYLKARRTTGHVEDKHEAKTEIKKIKPITVPVISGGELKGYVSVEFSAIAAIADKHDPPLDSESFIMDEAFRLIYADNKLDFSKLEKVDIDHLTKQIATNVNTRMGSMVVKEILVKNLTFVPKEDMPH